MTSSTSVFLICIVAVFVCSCASESLGYEERRFKRHLVEIDNPDDVIRVLGRLAQNILESEAFIQEKRGIDLGLTRGFSGSQQAKHLMGLAAAANGPGRRRRSAMEQ